MKSRSEAARPPGAIPPSSARFFPDRRGIATVVVFFVLLVLTIGVFSYFSFMRGRRLLQYRQLFGEFAYELAKAGLELTRSEVEASLANPDSDLYKKLLLAQNEGAWGGGGRTLLGRINLLSSSYSPFIDRVASSFGGLSTVDRLESEIYALVEDVDVFPPPPWAPALPDTRQKSGRIFIEVESVYKAGALLEGVSRRLEGYFEFRVLSGLLPLLNHFTLYLGDPSAGGNSPADFNASDTDFRGMLSSGAGPIVLNNGETLDAGEARSTMNARWLARQGFVYLGRKNELRLNLAFSHDAKEHALQAGEDFLFYQESTDPAVKESQRAYADARVNAKVKSPFWEVRFWDQGVNKLEDNELKFYKAAYDPAELPAFRSSLLHLFGAPPRGISPTPVFGRVAAGFLRLSAANPKGAPDEPTFQTLFTLLPGNGNVASFFKQYHDEVPVSGPALDAAACRQNPMLPGKFLFGDPATLDLKPESQPLVQPAVYSELMSRLTTRPYNQGLLFFKAENHDPEPTAAKVGIGIPSAYFESGTEVETLCKLPKELMLEAPDQGNFDDVDLEPILGQVKDPFPHRARVARQSREATHSVRFLEKQGWLNNGVLDLGTLLVWEQPGTFTLPEIRKLKRGGMIVADSFELQGSIEGESDTPPLVLLARTGNIRIAEPKPIFAVLIAPKGVLEAPKGLDVNGAILAQAIDFKSFQGRSLSHLQYNPRFKVGPWSATPSGSGGTSPSWSLVVDHSRDFVAVQ
ncbi:MAG: hypothetical protein HY814_13470 [Candidatus Riflebacteria bacterium]|nr:hypothetical protein [Candidatus Riflebacteria bacterium]